MAENSRPTDGAGERIRPHRQVIDGRPVLVIDADFMDDPRVEQVTAETFRLYLAFLLYSARHDSGGFIPHEAGAALVARWGE